MPTLFCLDTSFFINGWQKYYRIDVFPTIWNTLDKLWEAKTIMSCHEVYEEISKQHDELLEWAEQRQEIFQKPTEEVLNRLQDVMKKHPNFAAMGGSTNEADPWVIAHALEAGAVVVTDESPAPIQRTTKPPKIPDVCSGYAIPWLPPIDFLAHCRLRL